MELYEFQKLKDGKLVYEGVLYDTVDEFLSDLKEDLSGSGETSEDPEMMHKKKKVKEIMSEETEDEEI